MIKRVIIVSVIMIAGLSMVALSTRSLAGDNQNMLENSHLVLQYHDSVESEL